MFNTFQMLIKENIFFNFPKISILKKNENFEYISVNFYCGYREIFSKLNKDVSHHMFPNLI